MIDEIVTRYIQLRDRKAEMKQKFDSEVALIDEGMKKCEAFILNHFQSTGQTSAGTSVGTAFVASVTSATVADWDQVLQWIKQNDAWNFLDHKVNKTADAEFKTANDDLPPGVNWREESVVRVRRAS